MLCQTTVQACLFSKGNTLLLNQKCNFTVSVSSSFLTNFPLKTLSIISFNDNNENSVSVYPNLFRESLVTDQQRPKMYRERCSVFATHCHLLRQWKRRMVMCGKLNIEFRLQGGWVYWFRFHKVRMSQFTPLCPVGAMLLMQEQLNSRFSHLLTSPTEHNIILIVTLLSTALLIPPISSST